MFTDPKTASIVTICTVVCSTITSHAHVIPVVVTTFTFDALKAVTHGSGPWPNVIDQLVRVILGTANLSCRVNVYKWVFAPASLQNLCRYRLAYSAALQCVFPTFCIVDVHHPASRPYAYAPGDERIYDEEAK